MGLSGCWIVPMLALGLLSCPHPGACAEEGKQEIDTQFIFGFTAGADVGADYSVRGRLAWFGKIAQELDKHGTLAAR